MSVDKSELLAREVCAGCSPETASVYADLLIERGDPRGELVAIDVALATTGDDPQLYRRREELLERLLGAERPKGRVRYGLFDVDATGADPLEQLDLGLREHIAPYVRSVAVAGDVKTVGRAFERIARQLRPSLHRCVFAEWMSGGTQPCGDRGRPPRRHQGRKRSRGQRAVRHFQDRRQLWG